MKTTTKRRLPLMRGFAAAVVLALGTSVLAPTLATAAPTPPKPNGPCQPLSKSVKIGTSLYSCVKTDLNQFRWVKALYNVDCKSKPSKMVKIRMAALPILSNAAYYLGVEKGFFYKQGLDPEIQQVASPAAALASLGGGQTDFAFSTVITFFTATDAGMAIKFVAPAAGIRPKAYEKYLARVPGYTSDTTAMLVMANSGINRPKDLEGKVVTVLARGDQSEITMAQTIRKDGGDPSRVRWVPLGLADGINALVAGKVDAAFGVDPLNDKAVSQGAKVLAYPGLVTFQEGTTSGWAATNKYIDANKETVARFACAVAESNQYANEHPIEVKAKSADISKQPFESLKLAVVPRFYKAVSAVDLKRTGDLMAQLGYIKRAPNYAQAILLP